TDQAEPLEKVIQVEGLLESEVQMMAARTKMAQVARLQKMNPIMTAGITSIKVKRKKMNRLLKKNKVKMKTGKMTTKTTNKMTMNQMIRMNLKKMKNNITLHPTNLYLSI